ncbi:hypothetical protein [Rhizobium laguerreae]|uniref:hypothetical protein n=1 Tax=Rhizobium laguerreae TaxID=1076926 RepID=UPI003D7C1A29
MEKKIGMTEEKTSRQKRAQILPYDLPPCGLDRLQAAAYIGVSASLFASMVKDEDAEAKANQWPHSLGSSRYRSCVRQNYRRAG